VQCDTFNTEKYKGIPYLDVSTVYNNETKTVFINVMNRHKEKSIVTQIRSISGIFTGKAEASVLNCESLDAPFTFDKQEQYKPIIKEIKVEENNISYSFPPHSFTQIKVAVKKVAE
jgi:alpha-N-arabinofuranosidase